MDVTQADETRAIDIFDDALGNMSSFGEFGSPSCREEALRTISMHLAAHHQAALLEGVRIGIEAAASYVDGNGNTVIPGANAFVPLLIGHNQPCMSGDARDRLRTHTRRNFDNAVYSLAFAIRSLDPATVLAHHGGA